MMQLFVSNNSSDIVVFRIDGWLHMREMIFNATTIQIC
jgi:hypothetical protein